MSTLDALHSLAAQHLASLLVQLEVLQRSEGQASWHDRLEEFYVEKKRSFSYQHERLFVLLLLSGPTRREVDLLASIVEERATAVEFAKLMEALLARWAGF